MKKTILLLSVVMLAYVHQTHAADISAEKKAAIDKLFEQTGRSANNAALQMARITIAEMTRTIKEENPKVDPRVFKIVDEVTKSVFHEAFVTKHGYLDIMYPIYSEHFTLKELNEMVAFNETPLGKKIIRVMPEINREGIEGGNKLGEEIGPKLVQQIQTRLEKDGIKITDEPVTP